MSLLCVPIRAHSLNELRTGIKRASSQADVLEIWFDHLPTTLQKDPSLIRSLSKKKLLAVNKTVREKGKWKGTEKERIEILKQCAIAGFDYIDVGIQTDARLIKELFMAKKRAKLVLSFHDFTKTPPLQVLKKIIVRAQKQGADIMKIATFATKEENNLTILNLLADQRKIVGKRTAGSLAKKIQLAALAMGQKGVPSRLLAPSFGSYFYFAALDGKNKSAPGQLTIKDYKRFASFLKRQ